MGRRQVVAERRVVGQVHQTFGQAVDVDDLVDEDVGVGGQPDDVLAWSGVAGQGDGAMWRVEAEAERRKHRSVLHERCGHADPAIVLGVDHDRVHRRGHGRLRAAVCCNPEIDVGRVVVAAHPDLVHANRIGHVGAPFVGDTEVDVVGERP